MMTKIKFEITWEDVRDVAKQRNGQNLSKKVACFLLADIESGVRGWFDETKGDSICDALQVYLPSTLTEPRDPERRRNDEGSSVRNKQGYRYEVRYKEIGYTDGTCLFGTRKEAVEFISKLNRSTTSYELGHASDGEGHGWEFICGYEPSMHQEECGFDRNSDIMKALDSKTFKRKASLK